ncbi:MAG: hypothetical protein NTZ03_08555 [Actinobacteria bacterium]|nr:hypothetical protein [Actinomycetota bacterium]
MGHTEASADGDVTRTELVMSVAALPPGEREQAAEQLLRRPGVPGPATEHALQHLVGVWNDSGDGKRVDVIAKGATDFYAKQYRQYLNATMGAFAATATCALIGSGTPRATATHCAKRARQWSKAFPQHRRFLYSITSRSP